MSADEIILGLSRAEIISVIVMAVAALLLLILLQALLRLGQALARVGCVVAIIAVFLYTIRRMLN